MFLNQAHRLVSEKYKQFRWIPYCSPTRWQLVCLVLVSVQPDHPMAHYRAAAQFRSLGRYEQALVHFRYEHAPHLLLLDFPLYLELAA